MKRVMAIVLNWNGWRESLLCLESIRAQTYSDLSLILVDNGSSDDSVVRMKAAMPDLDIVCTNANLGFGGGCNVGIRLAMERGAEYVWLINSDAIADPYALQNMVRLADSDMAFGAVGAVICESEAPHTVQAWGGGLLNFYTGKSRLARSPSSLDFITGACVLYRIAALRQVGLFDESTFFMYWEDSDLGVRLRRARWSFGVSIDGKIWHKGAASLGQTSPLRDTYFSASGIRFFRRYAPYPRLTIFWMLATMVLRRLALGRFYNVFAVIRGWWRA